MPTNRVVTFAVIALLGAAADLSTKQWVFHSRGLPGERDPWWLIEGHVGIETAVNIGAVFGVGAGRGLLFAALSIVAGFGILIWLFWFRAAHQWWLTIALALVSGGILGNLYDRLGLWWQPGYPEPWKSGVRDWILWQATPKWRWPNFNIADSLLVIGAGMLLWRSFFPETVSASDDAIPAPPDDGHTPPSSDKPYTPPMPGSQNSPSDSEASSAG